jgi:hypothetical protein
VIFIDSGRADAERILAIAERLLNRPPELPGVEREAEERRAFEETLDRLRS